MNPAWTVLRRSLRVVALIAGVSLVINVLGLVSPVYMMQVYDRILTSRSEMTLVLMTAAAIGLVFILGMLDDLRNRFLVRIGVRIDADLHEPAFRAVFRRCLIAPEGARSQALQDISILRNFASGVALVALFDLPWTPLFILVCWAVHPLLAVVAVVAALLLLVVTILMELSTGSVLTEANAVATGASSYAETSLRNAEVIQAMGMLPGFLHRWGERYRQSIILQTKASDRAAVLSAMSKTIQYGSQIVTLAIGAYLVIRQILTPGLMIITTMIVARALMPINQIVASYRGFVAARGAFHRLGVLLRENRDEADNSPRVTLPAPRGEVVVDHVSVARPGGGPLILKNVAFAVPDGTLVGIIGPSGSGKTTLARAILGVLVPAQGIVRLDGASIIDWDRGELGPYIGYLPQDIELFGGSVAENIARFGVMESKEVVEAAQIAGVHEMILSLPDGYETQIGERGMILSAGQRQRVALARAVYGRPRLVILDEPNSNLDADGEQALHRALVTLRERHTTVLVIAHRSSILAGLDRLLVLKDGVIEGFAPTSEMLARLTRPVAGHAPAAVSS